MFLKVFPTFNYHVSQVPAFSFCCDKRLMVFSNEIHQAFACGVKFAHRDPPALFKSAADRTISKIVGGQRSSSFCQEEPAGLSGLDGSCTLR